VEDKKHGLGTLTTNSGSKFETVEYKHGVLVT